MQPCRRRGQQKNSWCRQMLQKKDSRCAEASGWRKTRRYLVYIPEGARPSTAGVFILPENGKTAEDLWLDSWWRMIADTEETKEKRILFFL